MNHLISTTSGGDLFETALAYNGGPGNLNRWKRALDIDDPLLFIESIPNPESRDFVEKVLTNVWVYRARLDSRRANAISSRRASCPSTRRSTPSRANDLRR